MVEEQASYRQIMKATSLFGGVQVFQIIIQIVRTKFIAVLLGPAGMGIAGLLTSTLNIIGSLSNFGLGTSAVKNISAANATGDNIQIAKVVKVLRRLVWITGILGSLIAIVLSPWLSQITFGNRNYILAFVWISVTLLFNQLTVGQMVVLQGMRKLQYLAKANIAGSALGLILTIPLYYKWGVDGIVPGIIVTAIIALATSWYFSGKVIIEPVKVSREQAISEGKNMLFMGLLISLSGLTSLGASYFIRIFISHNGGIEQVGLYNAGFAIINTYVGLIFTAMATDYYPRLSAVATDNEKCKETINQQAEIALLILAPILIVFLVFIKWVVIILYSTKFVAVTEMIQWAAIGMFFKAISWSIAFILLAKGVKKLYFINELVGNLYMLLINIIGYHFCGLNGLGISFLIGFSVYLLQVFIISKIKFDFAFSNSFLWICSIQLGIAILGFLSVRFLGNIYNYAVGMILILISAWYSLKELDKRIGLNEIIISYKNKLFPKL